MRLPHPGGVGSLVLPPDAAGEWCQLLGVDIVDLGTLVSLDEVIGPLGVGLLERL